MRAPAIRALAVLLAAGFVAGCGAGDPCDGHDGACLSLRVEGQGAVGALDQLAIHLTGAAQLDGHTPGSPGKAVPLPIATAIFLPAATGSVDISVLGLRAGLAVGQGEVAASIRPGAHVTATVTLEGVTASVDDLAVGDDLALGDGGGGGSTDMATLDLAGKQPRYVFLLSLRGPNLGTMSGLDSECTSTAATAGLPATPYKAVIAYPTVSPHDVIDVSAGRDIVLPDGTAVATDATFFTSAHAGPIDELANGAAAVGCVFTDFNPNGDRINAAAGDCAGWSGGGASDVAYVGDSSATDINWNFHDTPSCVGLSCYLYCIQQQ